MAVPSWSSYLASDPPGRIAALDSPSLAYRWTIAWRYANNANTPDHARRVFDAGNQSSSITAAPCRPTRRCSATRSPAPRPTKTTTMCWGQSLDGFERLVRSFTQPGDVVCDPFLGGGTTAIAALSQHRRFVGADIDADAIATTAARLTTEPT